MALPSNIDLKQLAVFVELYKRRSVSRAAEALDLPQPSVSITLAKLREHYSDPLFVRTGQTMQPTQRATKLFAPIEQALRLLDHADRETPEFEPATATRRFRLALADGAKPVVPPKLMRRLEAVAPNVTLEIVHIASDTPDALENGDVDLAFGFMPTRKPGLFHQVLFQDRFVCLVSRDKGPRRISAAYFSAAGHILVESRGTSSPIFTKALQQAGLAPKVAMAVPSYFGVAEVVAATGLIATMPYRMANVLAKGHAVRVLSLPIENPVYDVSQHWHRRMHQDQGHKWLRQQIFELFRDLERL